MYEGHGRKMGEWEHSVLQGAELVIATGGETPLPFLSVFLVVFLNP